MLRIYDHVHYTIQPYLRLLLNNPVNIVLTCVLCFLIYEFFGTEKPVEAEEPEFARPILFKQFTPLELSEFDGNDGKSIFISVKNNVYDVTSGRNFYGPGGPYENFAGRDASRGLAYNSFDLDVLTELDQPIDKLIDLNEEELEALDGWESHFANKYTLVGKLIEPANLK